MVTGSCSSTRHDRACSGAAPPHPIAARLARARSADRLRASPMTVTFPFLDWPGPIAFAHRGGASEAPENTMPAFEHAVRLGYRYLETDAHVTADGRLIAFHDDRLDRVTDRVGVISQLPWSEVQRARVDGREPIPLLEDLLAAWPDVRVNIDPKHDAAAQPLADAIVRTGTVDRVCVAAFSDRRTERVRAIVGPALCTGMGPRQVAQLVAASRGMPGAKRLRSRSEERR